ncbi:MAG: hypothetical protein F8N15_06760 [Methanobacterium sp.]|nr:hypothetical protein [Methanobacterium sp.]
MFEGNIKVSNRNIPRTFLGSSPFVAAPQFGHRARLYQLDLYNNPENILKIIQKSHDMGVNGIQIMPEPPVIEAMKLAGDIGINMDIVGTLMPETEAEDIELFSDMGAVSVMIHGTITDSANWDVLEEKLLKIKEIGAIPGLVTHSPFKTTSSLLESDILDLFDIYSVPVNKLGYLMDCDVYDKGVRTNLDNMMEELNKIIMVRNVLAAGVLKPDDAFDYLKTVSFADMVVLGIASVDEAQETFSLLKSL